ncbi:Signal transduction histidine kinase [Cupriavidus necator]|uniref:histidine kinase n=1 Tax=Cupriavidus necator (strain ATCC 17699 / DSM 428 / KCTC 22496 / NCIMB 10442 / H16 / Stanier 337) TaxID=381666 RepID=Q0KBQ8_CUPNH|nr:MULTISPECIES: ATP-binding protein [Cupriavidus]EON20553.1 signal transduction histidine kinase [Cupriavidus sp. GA3-3]KUE88812.1 histidine kinase [Cupriavidus necator]QCC00448.1 two-component sensor histidine kinase [Cupriavidus necator H16]QQB76734.1 two-component sensor histidine kinase [Cupriavidus necator]WKA42307.1 ATP-binding protein [Cupriavidus necator]
MTLQRRLILAVLIAAPVVWLLTIGMTYVRARHEINELYDTDMVRMALQMHSVVPLVDVAAAPSRTRLPELVEGDQGDAGLGDLAIAAWLPDGKPLHIDPEGDLLPRAPGVKGFTDVTIDKQSWRLYYLDDPDTGWRVCVGQQLAERNELILSYIAAQVLPWAAGLPVLIGLLIWFMRRAMAPVRALSTDIEGRAPQDRRPLSLQAVPGELVPLVHAMNRLLARVSDSIEHERRLTADAAHEMRTPLAALKAQWEIAERSADDAERAQARANVATGIDRISRLVSQLLTLSRLEDAAGLPSRQPVNWIPVAQQALSDCLALAQRKQVDVELEWPPEGQAPLPVAGDANLLSLLLRNLLDNAIRYSPPGALVTIDFRPDSVTVLDQGPGVAPDVLARLGDRFFRGGSGQREQGHGLGISIAQRVARLHGLEIAFANRTDGAGKGLAVRIAHGG